MKRISMLLIVAATVGMMGCELDETAGPPVISSIDHYSNSAIANAVIAQHAVFPYHFTVNAAELNELGVRDVGILGRHHKRFPGKVSVRQGEEPRDVYKARVETVRAALVKAGVPSKQIAISDDLAGGEGMLSERVLIILDPKAKRTTPPRRPPITPSKPTTGTE